MASIYAAVLLWLAYKKIKHTCSVQVRFRYDGDLFDLRRLKSKTKVLLEYIREAEYADDIAIFSDTSVGLQFLLTAYNGFANPPTQKSKYTTSVLCHYFCMEVKRGHCTITKLNNFEQSSNAISG